MTKLDDLDMKILRLLQTDCRISLQELAESVGSAISTIHYRVKRLEKDGLIKGYHAILDAEKLNLEFNGIISVHAKHGPGFEDLGVQLANIDGVWGVYWALGDVDYFILSRAKDRREFNKILRRIMNIEGVLKTNTHVIARTFKEDPQLDV